MNYFDFNLRPDFSEGESSIEDFAKRGKLLGYRGICISKYFDGPAKIKDIKKKCECVGKDIGIEIFLGLQARNSKELAKLTKLRREYDVLLVQGGDINLNRKAVETPEVDILLHPEYGRIDSGFNHIMAKLAHENNVAIEIDFREILLSSKNTRVHILRNMMENIKLCKKFGAPIIICSGSISHLQMKDPKILISMGVVLGLELKEAKESVSKVPENIIKMIKERQDERWIMPGLKVVD